MYTNAAMTSSASNTQTNQAGPIIQGPTVTVFHQNAAKPTSGWRRSSTAY
jgi:hypothetical protein